VRGAAPAGHRKSASPIRGARGRQRPDAFGRQIRAERAMWGEIIKAANITPQ
jgi:hypothetical protein